MSNEKGQFETDAQPVVQDENKQTSETEAEVKDPSLADDGTVKYGTYKKAVNQLKNYKSELEELRQFKQEKEEAEAMAKGEFQKILAAREEQIAEYKSKLESIDRDMQDGQKLNAFIKSLPGSVKNERLYSFVDLDQIAIDPETGKIDEMTLERTVSGFVDEWKDFIQPKTGKALPQVGSIGGQRPNVKKSLKDLSRDELRKAYLSGNFKN